MTLHYIVWDVSPEIFSIGNFSIRWYGLLFALSFVFGYLIFQKIFKKEGIPHKVLDELATYMIIATIVGARIGHCLFYEPEIYLKNPVDILKIWEGGLASHGAAIGIILALYFFSRKNKKPLIWILDRIVIVVALAGFFIRSGNLMNSEIFGYETNVAWAFKFVRVFGHDALLVSGRHPTQIYEALAYLAIFIFLLTYYYKKNGKPKPGFLFSMFLILVFTARFFIEFLKEPQVGFEENMVLNMGQWLSIPFVLAGIIILIFSYRKKAG